MNLSKSSLKNIIENIKHIKKENLSNNQIKYLDEIVLLLNGEKNYKTIKYGIDTIKNKEIVENVTNVKISFDPVLDYTFPTGNYETKELDKQLHLKNETILSFVYKKYKNLEFKINQKKEYSKLLEDIGKVVLTSRNDYDIYFSDKNHYNALLVKDNKIHNIELLSYMSIAYRIALDLNKDCIVYGIEMGETSWVFFKIENEILYKSQEFYIEVSLQRIVFILNYILGELTQINEN